MASPRSIVVMKEGKFWRVLSADLDPKPDEWADEVTGEDVFAEEDESIPF